MKETNIVQLIRLNCADIAILWRNNVGKFQDKQGRWVQFGLFVGSSDLIGVRRRDGKFIAIEVKVPGKEPTESQRVFIDIIRQNGGLAGVATSPEEARKIILG